MVLRVSGGNEHIARGNGTGTSRGGDTVGQDLVTGGLEVGVGEDEANVAYTTISAMAGYGNGETHP